MIGKSFEKSAAAFVSFVVDVLVDKKQTLLLCFIIGHCLVLYTLHLRLPPVMHAGTLPQPYRILSERGQKNLSVGIFLVPSCGICTTK